MTQISAVAVCQRCVLCADEHLAKSYLQRPRDILLKIFCARILPHARLSNSGLDFFHAIFGCGLAQDLRICLEAMSLHNSSCALEELKPAKSVSENNDYLWVVETAFSPSCVRTLI